MTCLLLILSDNCKKTAVVLDGAIGTVEFINCQSVQCQVRWLFFCISNVSNFSFFLFIFFCIKVFLLSSLPSLYYPNKSGLRVSCNFYKNTKNSVQFHLSNNIVDGLHIQALVVCTLVVSNLLLFLHELNKCNTKSRSKLHELDTDDVKEKTSLFSVQGKSAWYCFMVLCSFVSCHLWLWYTK